MLCYVTASLNKGITSINK